jgi:hypothetical protein
MLACTYLCGTRALHNGAMSIGAGAALAEYKTIIQSTYRSGADLSSGMRPGQALSYKGWATTRPREGVILLSWWSTNIAYHKNMGSTKGLNGGNSS